MEYKLFGSFGSIIICISLLTGCALFGSSPEEQIYEHLEYAVALENDFEQQQAPLVQLETKEKELYDEIIQLGMSQFDKIKKLSDEATQLVNEREERIDLEKESIASSKEEFLKTKALIQQIDNDDVKAIAQELFAVMETRYNAYDTLYAHYKEAIALDRELYSMFQKEDLTMDELEEQIHQINSTYEKVMAANSQFNEATEQYNEMKKNFYEAAGMEIIVE